MRPTKTLLLSFITILAVVSAGCASTAQHAPKAGAAPVKHEKAPKTSPQKVAAGEALNWTFLPAPRQLTINAPRAPFELPAGPVTLDGTSLPEPQRNTVVTAALTALTAFPARQDHATPAAAIVIDPTAAPHVQGYELTIGGDGVRIAAHDAAGAYYGAQTLRQIAQLAATNKVLPLARISDWPDFPNRGIMLDVARCKVPEMETLYALVDKFASWKLNQLQLYTEHTFAYRNHSEIWEDASPMTPVQIRELDRYCRERFIELVPNQNSFGHMGRWLQHDAYKHLGEIPNGGSDLCPVDPDCVTFLTGLYDDLLPNFSSGQANVGCDETASIGKGRSKDAVKAKGEGRVYLDFLLHIRDIVGKHGKKMQFWGDIIMNHKELIPELPKDVIAMEWGYEAKHPFLEHGKIFAQSGISYYVVPGSSSWNSLVGRTDNAVANLRNAGENGLANGAVGYLVTDWGDGGHWQFLPVSYLGFSYGAAVSWCVQTNVNADIPRILDTYVFQDDAGVMGKLAYNLGNAYSKTGLEPGNNTVFNGILHSDPERPFAKSYLKSLSAKDLEATLAYVDQVMAQLPNARMKAPDGQLIQDEFALGANMVRFACHLGIARVQSGGGATSALPSAQRHKLAQELAPIIRNIVNSGWPATAREV